MGETGKRSRFQQEDNAGNKSARQRTTNLNVQDGEVVVYRILCPNAVMGSVIGKNGKVINSVRQETQAKIKIVDPFPGSRERVITVYSYVKSKVEYGGDEEYTKPHCAAQDALLKIHAAIINAMAASEETDKRRKEEARILVPSSQSANIIGKSGSTIKKLRSETNAAIKVVPKNPNDPAHSCAMPFDNFIEISGEAGAVKKALFAVSAIMYKFPPKEEISLDTSVEPPSIIIPSDFAIYQAGSFYPGNDVMPSAPRPTSVTGLAGHVPELGYPEAPGTWPLRPSSVPVVHGYNGPARSEELIVRVLCPSDKIGRVIGKGGSSIKSVRQASGARVEVDDTKEDCDECVITVTSNESTDDIKSTAVEAVLLLQGKINDDDEDSVRMRILVPSKVVGCLIGKSGVIINEMRKKSKAEIRITRSEKPKCAFDDDELVEVVGEVGFVRDALVQIVLRLRDDILKDKEGGKSGSLPDVAYYPASSGGLSLPPSVLPNAAPIGYEPRMDHTPSGLGMLSGGNAYAYGSLQAENGYGSFSSYASKTYGGLPSSVVEVVIPAGTVGKVMGRGGSNISNIQKISGATVDVLDSKSSRGDRIAHVSGTPEQIRSAENLLQAFIMAT